MSLLTCLYSETRLTARRLVPRVAPVAEHVSCSRQAMFVREEQGLCQTKIFQTLSGQSYIYSGELTARLPALPFFVLL
jgi:hypothetical protein